jgi:hypothetical protein
MNSTDLKSKAYTRAAQLLDSPNIEKDIHNLCLLTKEQHPKLNNDLLEELVFENIMQYYNDQELDFLWFNYQNSQDFGSIQYPQAA